MKKQRNCIPGFKRYFQNIIAYEKKKHNSIVQNFEEQLENLKEMYMYIH